MALDEAAKLAMEIEQTFEEEQTSADMVKHLGVLRGKLPIHLGRIGIRLGPDSDEFKAYERCVQGLTRLGSGIEMLPRDLVLTDEAIDEALEEMEPEKLVEAVALMKGYRESKAALTEFMAAAHARIGVDV
jgi:hypothetical protein